MPPVFFEILLAHLLGDFVFQSNDLIQKKYKSWTGTFEHVCIIAVCTILFLFPYWNQAWTWYTVALIFSTHFIQDCLKIRYDIRFNLKKKSTLPFFVDQLFHISLIAYVARRFNNLPHMALPNALENLYFSKAVAIFAVGLILVSYTYDITRFQFERQHSKQALTYTPDRAGMSQRLFLYGIGFALFLVMYRSFM